MTITAAKEAAVNDLKVNGKDWPVPCWLCGEPVRMRFSKKNKPFLLCKNCGTQVFIRYDKGEDLLIEKIQQYHRQQIGG